MTPASVLGTCFAWPVRHGVPVFFAGGRRNARGMVYRLLFHLVRIRGDPVRAQTEGLIRMGEGR